MIKFKLSGKYQLKPQAINSEFLSLSGVYRLKPQAINAEFSSLSGAYKFPSYPENRIIKNPDGGFDISPKFPDPEPPISIPPGGRVVEMAEETSMVIGTYSGHSNMFDMPYSASLFVSVTLTWTVIDGMVRFISEGSTTAIFSDPYAARSRNSSSYYTSYMPGSIPYFYQRINSGSEPWIYWDTTYFASYGPGSGTRTFASNYSFTLSGGSIFS